MIVKICITVVKLEEIVQNKVNFTRILAERNYHIHVFQVGLSVHEHMVLISHISLAFRAKL